ncbi:MAG: hypothetical protein ABI324_20565 [Ktedonobacteraceae bacterium]
MHTTYQEGANLVNRSTKLTRERSTARRTTLTTHFQVDAEVETHVTCLDQKVQWSEARNIWQNAGLGTMLYTLATPWRWLRTRGKR